MAEKTANFIEADKQSTTSADPSTLNSLACAFKLWAESIGLQLNVCQPAIVTGYNRTTRKATVKPLVKKIVKSTSETVTQSERTVTVLSHQVGNFIIDLPVSAGDTGWLFASDRNCSSVKDSNGGNVSEMYESTGGFADGKGPKVPTYGSFETHVYDSGFFIPDRWGDVFAKAKEDPTKKAVINYLFSLDINPYGSSVRVTERDLNDHSYLGSVSSDGMPGGGLVLSRDGNIALHKITASDGSLETTEQGTPFYQNSVVVGDKLILSSANKAEDEIRYDTLFADQEGLHFSGKIDRTLTMVTDVRYDVKTHQLQKKSCSIAIRGDFIVGISQESGWSVMEGGQAVEETT